MTEDVRFPADDFLLLGKIARAHGLRGEVKVFLHSGQPENLRNYRELFLSGRAGQLIGPLTVLRSRDQGKFAIVQFASITSRDQAEEIEGSEVLLKKDELPPVADDEYYWHEYIGKTAVQVTGEALGEVKYIFHNGLQDVLVIQKAGAEEEIFIPVTPSIVVGETAEELVLDPPPGLLEINATP